MSKKGALVEVGSVSYLTRMTHHDQIAPQWLTLKGAAKYSGLSARTIENYINEGHIVSANIVLPGNSRGRRLVHRGSFDAFVERYVVGSTREVNEQQRSLLALLTTAADAIAEARRIAMGLRGDSGEFLSILCESRFSHSGNLSEGIEPNGLS